MENKLELKAENEISNYNTLKRFIDIIISVSGIIILAPIFLITSILIKLESDGPIIFKQLRAGKNSKPFYIYKFRSMKKDAPTLSTNEFDDANLFITKTGRFIRKTSIDELPQLINILKGDMSIVGPRPVILDEKELILLRQKYNIDIILPGITGLAQINGRDSIGEKEKVKLDYQYLKNRSLILDIKIVFITIFKVLKKSDIKKEI
ncbi:MAG: sugar transferase [Paraclostridium sp.]|uniref:sugar transferase n=1 Tax=Paraclostridium sp. TaxID=2023273 RepID=UPI003F2C8E98